MKDQDMSTAGRNISRSLAALTCELGRLQSEWSLVAFPHGLERAVTALSNPEYDVVVCGEVKRGKSTFINALIGKHILPTGVRETTSQVFRIGNTAGESFALVFEDGCREPITAEGLATYGSQTATELEGIPLFRGRVLRWIEVNTPTAFLPEGVHLVDTPGLGALYASHSEITNRYILRADAVIFVLDSDQPMTHSEKRFLEKALDITPNALFVQTKIDTKNESAWQTVLHRNEELLNEAFRKEGRPRIHVYPVSSTLLFKAAQEKDAQERDYLVDDSLFEQARTALDRVIYKAVGWTRSAWAAAEAAKYIHSVSLHLGEQREIVTATTLADKAAIRQRKSEIRLRFQQEWGTGGTKRGQFSAEVERILRGVRQTAYNIGTPGSELHSRIMGEINNLPDRHVLEQYAAALPRRVQEGVENEWREIILAAQRQISALDGNFSMALGGQAAFKVNLPQLTLRDPSVWDRVKAVNIDGMIGGGIAAIVADLFLTGGFATLVTVAGGLLGGSQGLSRVTSQQLETGRNEIRQNLSALLAQCRNALCTPDLGHGRSSACLDVFLDGLQSQVEANIAAQYAAKKNQLEREEQCLDEQAKMTGQRQQDELSRLQARITQFDDLQVKVDVVIHQLRDVQTVLDQVSDG